MSIAPPGHETPQASPPPAPQAAPIGHKDAKAEAAAAKAYAKAQRPWYKMKRWWAAGLLLLAIVGIAGSGTSTTSSDANGETSVFAPSEGDGADASPSDEASTFENGVLTTPDMRIEILRHKVIGAGQKGNEYGEKPVVAFWYTTTNLSGDDVDPTDFQFNFTAYQDNDPNVVNELEWAIGTDLPVRGSHDVGENIKKGGTVEDATAYELDDLVTPVELVATDGLLGDVIGKGAYALR